MLLRTEVEEVRAALYLLFWAVTVADGGGLAVLGDGDGVVGDFRAVGRPVWTMLSVFVHR